MLYSDILQPARMVIESAWLLGSDFTTAINNGNRTWITPPRDRGKQWQKPKVDRFKLNVDGAFFNGTGQGAIEVIARDLNGMNVGGHARKPIGTLTAEILKAEAFRVGIELAKENGWIRVDIEEDSYAVI
ncbi:hypothetical protein F3Y22_tig00002317pilonHSYRG00166 [Hibiscus syriacus]|uniref:RNase H type-1 domain-containing protein n=1 Tax=Hibiscus syriacus TaxID=106335 RepID=A0A6A3CU20_HIBSY|nr:hypothetical protein F3Y22_tig00002317pilonHSYRG00166 [Hibiscus syriacus]